MNKKKAAIYKRFHKKSNRKIPDAVSYLRRKSDYSKLKKISKGV
jgi:hypothetical protein